MAFQSYLRLVLLYSFANIIASTPSHYHNHAVLNRSSFPPGFIFGTASSSYQYEGAAKDGGRGPSIWDTFTHRCPFSIRENQLSGQQAFKSMERRGGTRSDSSFGTFPNWCHKDRIQDGSNGDVTVDQYHRYKEDVGIMRQMGLDAYRFSISWSRVLPNGRLSGGVNMEGIKYYNNLINELLAKGLKPFVTLFHFDLPQSLEDDYGGFLSPHIVLMDPLINGDYPHSMRSLVGNRLPKFTKEQSKLVNRSFDFIGLNYYTAYYAAYAPQHNAGNASYFTDSRANLSTEHNGIPIGQQAASEWLHLYPRGIRDLLLYIKQKYHNPLIYITENGIDEFNNATLSLEEALVDNQRIEYYCSHLWYLQKAIRDGVNVKGYFAWSLLDNFEWNSGYTVRFGINYVDYKDGCKRHPKLSAHWFTNFLKK
ncbi:beta-glucosidase 12-like isoform X7 [Juglans microcarpa x Juglans regia]|uniref:beta-glucosidase 12-like isoform X7 n=1 Tax=Juglans microcarpa x Juglans regia TaxID=2249226 RepID=UPI001B7EBD19|nr:beta-glucosidase 12-like isoform X7 [Juglans microcarpa x Juglans regia]